MHPDQTSNGGSVPVSAGQHQVPQNGAAMPAVTYSAAHTTQQPRQMLASLGQAAPIDPSQLLMNPHTAAMVATVAAAAAQQMAQHQHVAQQHHHHAQQQHAQQQHAAAQQQHVAAQHQQVIQAPAPTPSQQPQHHVAAAVAQPPAPPLTVQQGVPQIGMPPHLAALFGMTAAPPAAVYQQGAQVVAAPVPTNSVSTALLSNMQNWKLNQLEAHVQMLRDTNQSIPQAVAMLLADARRKEDKRTAKRVANRKSACTSRARKKALVEEMTRTNARLKRQALILALLPDLVVAITIEGEITFCSAQVERVLRHQLDDLIGANLKDLLIPASRKALTDLVQELVAAELAAVSDSETAPAVAPVAQPPNAPNEEHKDENGNGNQNGSAQESSLSSGGVGGPAVVSDQSFPLSVVKVKQSKILAPEENSDVSLSNGKTTPAPPIVNSNSNSSAHQSTNSSLNPEDPANPAKTEGQSKDKPNTSSDESLSSSSDANNLRQANENLNRNVRWHNKKLLSQSKTSKAESIHKDDVTGEAVTANNASARLSSLQHRPAQKRRKLDSMEDNSSADSSDDLLAGVEEKKKKTGNGSSSDESGYRESNESARFDTSSSASDMSTSGNGRRHKPLAPACNICLIRDDLTTIWCEVTSSIRTRSLKEEAVDPLDPLQLPPTKGEKKDAKSLKTTSSSEDAASSNRGDEVKELLLCLRPIRDGEQKVDESLRFRACMGHEAVISSPNETSEEGSGKDAKVGLPMKKRPVPSQESKGKASPSDGSPEAKKAKFDNEVDKEKSVAESLMQMGRIEN